MKKALIILLALGLIVAGGFVFHQIRHKDRVVGEIAVESKATQAANDTLIKIDNSHEGLTVYYPKFKSIDLVCGTKSPMDDRKAILSCAAAFTGSRISEFRHSNIAGNHVSGGEYENGYKCDDNTGAFVWYGGKWQFLLNDYNSQMKKASEKKGMGFAQNMIIFNGKAQPQYRSNRNIYRALCELNGKLCVIQSDEKIRYRDFVDMLMNAGVTHALYLDMGGWREGWYRMTEESDITYLCKRDNRYYTNWLTFYK
ncbi:MAG: hypothetical protein IKW20_03580 [Bacteroidales bacterium]|nr:hypothetical protein [Bacteroidales bacterium]